MFSGIPPDCKKCGFEICLPENYEFMSIFERYSILLWNGMGGVDTASILLIVEQEDIEDFHIFLKKFTIFTSAGLNKQHEDSNNGTKNRTRMGSKR